MAEAEIPYTEPLDPDGDPTQGPITYWGVPDTEAAIASLLAAGAPLREPVRDVGDGIRVASVLDPGGAILGIVENPHFQLQPVQTDAGAGR